MLGAFCWALATARAEDLLDDLTGLLFLREMQDGQRLPHKPVADEVRHQPGLLGEIRTYLAMACDTKFLSFISLAYLYGLGRFGGMAFKSPRRGEFPSLCPTMFSVMKTGMNFLPLCTAIVTPTISGMMVERRDQVLITFLSLTGSHRQNLLRRGESMNGPFLRERLMTIYSFSGR